MRILKKLFKYILLLLILLLIGTWLFARTLYPKYSGELELNNIKEKITVHYDDNGVPHITAKNQKDAYTAFGYVHAQDRLWQMEVIRRIGAGRLSEIFGKDMVRVDKFMGSLGIEENAYKTIASLDKNSKSFVLAKAYLDGINQFIENGPTPIEFYLVGVKKEKYTLKDVYNVFGYMAFSFAVAHKTDPLLTEIYEKLGPEYVKELEIPTIGMELMKNFSSKKTATPEIKAEFSASVNKILEKMPMPMLIGSNSWVLGTERTKNGKVIFANDPHIQFSQPSVWYQNHIRTPNFEMYGFNLALTPFPLLGHNRKYAYGLTMFENDDVDFYIEENNPQNNLEYKTENGYARYKTLNRTIKIKGGKDTIFQLKVSRHGPILNDAIEQIKSEKTIAMQWIYTHLPNKILDLTYQMSHSDSLAHFKKSASMLHAPGLNIMYGDAKNNIARFSSAKLYKYRDSLNRKMYLNGASGKDEIIRFLDFEDNPQAVNPTKNYVYSANNQPDSIANMLYPGYYLPEDRAKRIVEIIEPKYNFSQEDVQKMLLDVQSPVATQVIKGMTEVIALENLSEFEKKALDELLLWNGQFKKNNTAPTIYNRFKYEFLKNTFKDEMQDGFELFMTAIPLQKKMIAVQMNKFKSVYWDNILTKDIVETKKDIVTKSFKNTVSFLKNQLGDSINDWTWNRVLTVEYEHPIGKGGELLRKIFNVGPFETNGGDEVINNQIHRLDSTGIYTVKAGPSTRRVVDFSDVENAKTIIPTGQSGNRFSPFYKNQAKKYINGEFVKMIINPKEFNNSKRRLVFLPK